MFATTTTMVAGCNIDGVTKKRERNMKSLKIFSLVMLLALALTGCKNNKTPQGGELGGFDAIEKEWKLVSVNGAANDFHVYISFTGGTFALYQQVYSLDFLFYEGTYSIDGNTLSGSYFDGTDWKSPYTGGISKDGNTMTLKSKETNPVTYVYEACEIPEDIMEEATRAAAVDAVPFL